MNDKITTKELVLSGLLLAAGLVLPMVFHMFSMTGPVFLPMHIPVLIGGMLLPPAFALLLGVITPVMSSILTGMPVVFPMAIIMAFELGTYALSASIATRKLKLNPLLSLIIAMIVGRIIAGLVVSVLVQLFGVKMDPIMYVKGAIVTGLPGLMIQIVFIPTLIYALKKGRPITVGQ
ncbi:ECF transporter S component [Tissierella creatinini]|nr:ECF transporter S component [Tissierella creatinini]TJX62370.1 ECF transporter S component [Soehngenia saccharolytica]